jgi:prephenate dehydrogenase
MLKRVGIIGLGLMGGSFALAIKEVYEDVEIVGYDLNKTHLERAKELKLIDRDVGFEEIKDVDLLILSIPVEAIITLFEKLQDIDKDTTIIDIGSTKSKIVKAVPKSIRENFVATHPMAGTEKFGPDAAQKGLFRDKIAVLCNTEDSGESHMERVEDIYKNIGMNIVYMDASEHDKHAAYISHLPHAISYALANSVLEQEDPKSILTLAAGGFRDMSRIAKSSPEMWRDIFCQNRENLLESLDDFSKELNRVKELIESKKWDELEEWMKRATTLHEIF